MSTIIIKLCRHSEEGVDRQSHHSQTEGFFVLIESQYLLANKTFVLLRTSLQSSVHRCSAWLNPISRVSIYVEQSPPLTVLDFD